MERDDAARNAERMLNELGAGPELRRQVEESLQEWRQGVQPVPLRQVRDEARAARER